MKCPYCGLEVQLVDGRRIYPHRPDLYQKKFYLCAPCDAYVGCHAGTTNPLGRLADSKLRRAKLAAHAAFDPLWKNRTMTRGQAYAWLATQLRIPQDLCHIGMMDVDQCRQVVEIVGRMR
jgi:hypothetical protein